MPVLNSYFDSTQLSLLASGGVFFLLSLVMQWRNNQKFSFVFLGLTALCIFSFSALLDPFLNLWDERFHALVAKNLMHHPLMPTLYDDPVVIMDYDRWDRYHIWLHKQPLFLWQIALGFKIFGVSEFALRIPNIVLGTVLVLITYRSGKLVVNERVGYVAGVFTISTIYLLEIIAGRQELEHNDLSFLAYVSLSIWAFIEYRYTGKKFWIYLIGLFSGLAILCKWLVGLLVYLGWFILRASQKKFKISQNKDILIALGITILVALPWQILTFWWYPTEALLAYKYNSIHFTVPLEGHGGNFWYHFGKINTIYGKAALALILPAFAAMYIRAKDKKITFILLSMVVAVYLFFSMAATKMPSFTLVVSMIVFIAFASLFDLVVHHLQNMSPSKSLSQGIFGLLLIAIVLLRFDVELLQEKHTFWKDDNVYTRMLSHNREVFKSLEYSPHTVLFNVKGRHYVEAMFYTGMPAYNFVPSYEQYQDLKNKGRTIAIFVSEGLEIPDYLLSDGSVMLINQEIKGYE